MAFEDSVGSTRWLWLGGLLAACLAVMKHRRHRASAGSDNADDARPPAAQTDDSLVVIRGIGPLGGTSDLVLGEGWNIDADGLITADSELASSSTWILTTAASSMWQYSEPAVFLILSDGSEPSSSSRLNAVVHTDSVGRVDQLSVNDDRVTQGQLTPGTYNADVRFTLTHPTSYLLQTGHAQETVVLTVRIRVRVS